MIVEGVALSLGNKGWGTNGEDASCCTASRSDGGNDNVRCCPCSGCSSSRHLRVPRFPRCGSSGPPSAASQIHPSKHIPSALSTLSWHVHFTRPLISRVLFPHYSQTTNADGDNVRFSSRSRWRPLAGLSRLSEDSPAFGSGSNMAEAEGEIVNCCKFMIYAVARVRQSNYT
jgi:hypothetical protein